MNDLKQMFTELFLDITDNGVENYIPHLTTALSVIYEDIKNNSFKNIPKYYLNLLLISFIYNIEDETIQQLRLAIAVEIIAKSKGEINIFGDTHQNFTSQYFECILGNAEWK